MRKNNKLIFLFGAILFINGCIPVLRSPHGLKKGKLQVSYNAPFAGDIRYGLTDNMEYRYSIIGESFESDVMFHFHKSYDYSIAIGLGWLPDWEKDQMHYLPNHAKSKVAGFALSVGKEYWERVNPYIGFSYSKRIDEKAEGSGFFTTGLEITLAKRNKYPLNLVLTPELVYIPGGTGGDINYYFWGTLGIGMNFDLEKIINRK